MQGELDFLRRSVIFAIFALVLMNPALLSADIVRDGSIGPDSSVQPVGPDFEISESFGELSGTNLFHSFQEFNLTQDQSATFSGTSPIDNIISRVTGGSASSIDGLLSSTISGAALYLMNPDGIVFGPNARLDVQGAFHASTAGELLFTTGETFSADVAASSVLSLALPEAFGFLGEGAAPIELNGSDWSSVHDIALSAGTVGLTAGASITTMADGSAAGGDITLAAADSISFSGVDEQGSGSSLIAINLADGATGTLQLEAPVIELGDGAVVTSQVMGAGAGGDLLLTATQYLSLSGVDGNGRGTFVIAATGANGDAGAVYLDAPSIELKDGAVASTATGGAGLGGDVFVTASQGLALAGTDGAGLGSRLAAGAFASGDAGNLYVDARVIEMHDGAFMTTHTQGTGAGGDLSVTATESLSLLGGDGEGRGSRLIAATVEAGAAGTLKVEAPVIELRDGGHMTTETQGAGEGGNLVVTASQRLTLVGVDESGRRSHLIAATFADGDAGTLQVEAPVIELLGGAVMTTETNGAGMGGDLLVTATERLTLSGIAGDRGAGLATTAFSEGDAGVLQVAAPVIELHDGAFMTTQTEGTGRGGHLWVEAAERLVLTGNNGEGEGASLRASSFGSETGGDVYVQAPYIALMDRAVIESESSGAGNAGSITVIADDELHLFGGSAISTESNEASGGDITILVDHLINLQESEITTNVGSGTGQGGDIFIDPDLLVINRSQITAQAADGTGGNIHIVADNILVTPDSVISASAGPAGVDGNVVINTPESDLVDELARPATEFLDASALLQPGCEARGQGPRGRFTVARQQGLPLSPENLLLAYDVPAPIPQQPASLEVSALSATPASRGAALRGIALKQQSEGHYGASLDTLNSALTEHPQHLAATLGSAANAYLALGLADTALANFRQAIDAASDDDHRLLATLHNNLGNLHMVRQDHAAASAAYRESAQQAAHANDITQQAKALSNGARAAFAQGRQPRAVALQQRARQVVEAVTAGQDKAYILIHLAKTAQHLSSTAANDSPQHLATAYSDLRNAALLSRDFGDDRTLAYALGNLGGVYQQRNRFDEALFLTQLAQQAAERANAPEALSRWHWQAGQIRWAQGHPQDALQAYRRAVAILEGGRPETLAQYGAAHAYFRQAVAPVYLDFVDALLQYSSRVDDPTALLLEARATVEHLKAAELRNYFRDECITELEAKNNRLENISPTAAIIYPIILPQRLELLVSLPSGLHRYPVAVDTATLTQTTRQFRTLVETQGGEQQLRNAAQRLYDWLVRPYAEELNVAGIDTLVFVPDGPLRAAPLAALHDGHDYLIRRYGVVVTPGLSLTDPQPLNRKNPRLLLAGLSEPAQNYSALPYVTRELEYIHRLFGGRILLNERFTQSKIARAMGAPVTIVHVASHAEFTGNADDSYLLTHDGRMSMDQLGDVLNVSRFRERPLELLVLSACQTAVGDDRAAMGLAGIGLKAGARSAVGSLWFISDEGTSELMESFYSKLKDPKLTKAQALQQAQQAMLDGRRLAHPYYWSPFLLMNNWL